MIKFLSSSLRFFVMQACLTLALVQNSYSQEPAENHDGKQVAPHQIYTLVDSFELESYREIVRSTLTKLGRLKNDGQFRLWAIDVSDNKNHYCLSSGAIGSNSVAFYEHRTAKSVEVNIGEAGVNDLFKKINHFLASPLVFPKSDSVYGATVEHVFILEKFSKNKYQWAVRKYRGDECNDYFDLVKIFTNLEGVRVSMAWKIDRKE